MPHSKDFYRRLILSCFSRKAGADVSAKEIHDVANRILSSRGTGDIWSVVEEMTEQGYITLHKEGPPKIYRLRCYVPK